MDYNESSKLDELGIANKEKAKCAAELVIANEEKAKREAELVIANVEKEKLTAGINGGKIWVESECGKALKQCSCKP